MSTAGRLGPTSSVARTTMRIASTWSTTPVRRAAMATPESRATTSSMPVPTSGDRDDLLGRDVDEVDRLGPAEDVLAALAALHQIGGELAAGVDLGVGLGHRIATLLHRREVDDLVGDAAAHDLAVRTLDEAVLVHAGVGRQRVDQADVGAFRRLDRADAAVM